MRPSAIERRFHGAIEARLLRTVAMRMAIRETFLDVA
jgi:hypothetical protein